MGGSSGWGWGIAQKSHHWEGDLEMLKGAKLLKQTWQMELSVQRCSTGLAYLGACRAVCMGSGSMPGFGRNSWAQEVMGISQQKGRAGSALCF